MERWSFVSSQNILIDGYATAFTCSCKQRDQGQNIMQLQTLMRGPGEVVQAAKLKMSRRSSDDPGSKIDVQAKF